MVMRSVKSGEIAKGNGRLVRNMVEAAIARQTNRVFALGTVTRGTLTTLLRERRPPAPWTPWPAALFAEESASACR